MKRLLLVVAATAIILLAFAGVAGAQAYPPNPDVGAGGASNAPCACVASAGSQLAFTGSDHGTEYLLVGAGAVVLGGALVVMSKRRRSASNL